MAHWRAHRSSLKGIASKEDLDAMFDQARSNCMAAGNVVLPVVLEGIFIVKAFSEEQGASPTSRRESRELRNQTKR